MSRATIICLGLMLAGLSRPALPASAQSAARPIAVRASAVHPLHHGGAIQQRMRHDRWVRSETGRWRGAHRGRGLGQGVWTPFGYGPWSVAGGGTSAHAIDTARPVDRNSFEHMPVQIGIARSPTPEPTLYRLEGRPERPATRVIRINDPEPRQGRRTRFAHAETGALLLVVPGR